MSKTTDHILMIQEQTGINLIKHQKEVDYYNSLSAEEVEQELSNDPGYSEFLDSLEDKNRVF
jgi:hypothetical protein